VDSLLTKLDASHTVLDLGCGGGSFHYEAYPFRTIATDIQLPRSIPEARRARTLYFRAESATIPLADDSVDAVICHNTLEHFLDYRSTLGEIRRVLRTAGWLWIAVPNGYGLDDHLYRLVFEGGGHVNRFRFKNLISEVEQLTGLQLVQTCDLFSSFIFLHRPSAEEAAFYPRTAHVLANIPEDVHRLGVLALNTATRLCDRWLGCRLSQYGWGFVFGPPFMTRERLPSFFNVCRKCGSGCAEHHIKRFRRSILGLRPYHCPHCDELNVFVRPPRGFD
jgi:SAM-dependent methyltransferase